jgi:hypothetical protein
VRISAIFGWGDWVEDAWVDIRGAAEGGGGGRGQAEGGGRILRLWVDSRRAGAGSLLDLAEARCCGLRFVRLLG